MIRDDEGDIREEEVAEPEANASVLDPAPKRYLLDDRLLHAGTEGVNYCFSKDLEDIDWSCTALWGSVVEGVDEGDGWLCVCGELYLPTRLAGVPILTIEESPWALAGLQVVEAFPIGSAVLMLEAAIMRAAEDLRSTAICQLEKEQRMQILGHGTGARNRRLFVQDPVSGQDGWISFVSQTGKLLVAPLDHSPDQMQKVATMITTRQQPESLDVQDESPLSRWYQQLTAAEERQAAKALQATNEALQSKLEGLQTQVEVKQQQLTAVSQAFEAAAADAAARFFDAQEKVENYESELTAHKLQDLKQLSSEVRKDVEDLQIQVAQAKGSRARYCLCCM